MRAKLIAEYQALLGFPVNVADNVSDENLAALIDALKARADKKRIKRELRKAKR